MGASAKPKTAVVKEHRGRPTIFIDGVPQAPVFYGLTHAFGGRKSWEEVPQRNLQVFAAAGITLFQIDLHFQDIWLPDEVQLDLSVARRQVAGVLNACPSAAIVLRVHVNAPFWWNERHPEECTEYADGPVEQRTYGPPFHHEDGDKDRSLRASLASRLWRRQAGLKLEELCRRLGETDEGKSVVGIHVAGGIYGEWHYWGFMDHEPDTGPAMTTAFREWLRERYGTDEALTDAWGDATTIDGATVPGTEERERTTDGFFKDPAADRRVIDYFACQQEVVADDIEHFCGIVKDNWPRSIITGVFYGYFHLTFNRQTVGGHLCVERILDSPVIDYLAAPQTYWSETRGAGGSGNSRGIVESALLHGKLWLDEVDNGYQQVNPAADFVRYMPRRDRRYLEILRRSTLLPVLRGGGYWYYDFGAAKGYGWWDSPLYLGEIKRQKRFFDRLVDREYTSESDVLFVWSMESFYTVKPQPSPISEPLLDASTEEALRSGVSGDHIFDFDLPRADVDRYRVVVLMNLFTMSDELSRFIEDRVARDGRTVVFNYLSGLINGTHLSLNRVSRVAGFGLEERTCPAKPRLSGVGPLAGFTYHHEDSFSPYLTVSDSAADPLAIEDETGEVVLARKADSEATRIFAALPVRSDDLFRRLFSQAGCHVYADGGEVVFARFGLLLVHTSASGDHEIQLRSGRRVTIDSAGVTTVLLDAESGETQLHDAKRTTGGTA